LARANHINLIKRNHLDKLIITNDVTIQEVNKHEAQRMQRIELIYQADTMHFFAKFEYE